MTAAVPVLHDLLAQGDLLLFVHRNGKMLFATPAVHDFLGIAPNASFENVDIFLFVDPTERSESRDNLARVMASNRPTRAIPRTVITSQGLRRKTLGTTMRVDWEGETALLAVVAIIDDQQAFEPHLVENLSPRASQIALLVALGFDVPQMAALLGVKPNTIRTYIKAIYRKTGTHARVELAHRLLGRQEG